MILLHPHLRKNSNISLTLLFSTTRPISRVPSRSVPLRRNLAPCFAPFAGTLNAVFTSIRFVLRSLSRKSLIRSLLKRRIPRPNRSEEHTSELQSRLHLVCRLLLEKKKQNKYTPISH